MRFRASLALAAAIMVTAPTAAQAPEPVGIVMQIDALKTSTGAVICDLYAAAAGFPNKPERAIARVVVRPRNTQAVCAFADAGPGRYAVAIWHDVDDDRKLATNWLGIPKEPVGSSNNAKGKFGPPKFKDAAFDYRPPGLQQAIRLE